MILRLLTLIFDTDKAVKKNFYSQSSSVKGSKIIRIFADSKK